MSEISGYAAKRRLLHDIRVLGREDLDAGTLTGALDLKLIVLLAIISVTTS